MTEFDFTREMVYGKKHVNKINFDKEKYDLYNEVTELFGYNLNQAHLHSEKKYELFTELGKDSHTIYHRKFYDKIDCFGGWPSFVNKYNSFIEEVILPYLGLDEALVQVYPCFRVQLPDNVAVVVNHYDSDENHKHPYGEINFIYALTDMFDTNTVKVEKMPRSGEFISMEMERGDCISFNGNKCEHHNEINKTGKTRMSFDFRVLPLNYYNENYSKKSVTTSQKYIEGGYYRRFFAKKSFVARDIWDKEKEKFNVTLQKYNLTGAWEIVDLFEKRMAEYAGSKYAVSVDSCTDALFLCLKYLQASDEITIPNKTWISVPCTIKHAGCEVKFEEREWSGSYQLKPYPVFDGAVRMKKGMFKSGTYHCLSFHIRKHIPIGKGGMILTDDKEAYDWFRTVRYEGRTISDDGVNYVMYKDDEIKSMGWNMYMTPEQAARGLELFEKISDDNPDQESSGTCKDLSQFDCYF
jgi:hypothetical protein